MVKQNAGNSKEIRLGLLLWFRLAKFYNKSNRLSNQHLKKWGLTISQFDLLVQVGANQPLSQQELANKLLVSKGNITQMLVKLENAGFIRREQKWRIKYISLTGSGRQLYEEVVPAQEQFQALQFKGLNKEEQKQLLGLLKKLYLNSKEN